MRTRVRHLDLPLLIPILLLVAAGTLTIYSAGRGTSQSSIWLKQSLWNVLGLLAMTYLASLNPRQFFRASMPIYLGGILLLVLVMLVGKRIGGSQRWLVLAGLSFQPSELMKWLTLLFVSHRLGSRPPEDLRASDLAGVAALVVFPMLLVFRQPDLGMALSFLPLLVLIPVVKGLRKRWVAVGLAATCVVGFLAWNTVLKPYQKQRVVTFLNPESDLQGKGYQINQSRIAIGAGGLTGQGFMSGSQTQLNFLPVKTTDFVFSVWAEERGFLGVLLALGLFGALLSRILAIGREADSSSEAYFCVGAAVLFAFHVLVNVGMVAGLLPNKGLVLPFFSAGGSSTLSYFMGLGLVMAAAYRAKTR